MVYGSVKFFYGLKWASIQWNVNLINALVASLFIQSNLYHSLFTTRNRGHIVVILVYVDYMLVVDSDLQTKSYSPN